MKLYNLVLVWVMSAISILLVLATFAVFGQAMPSLFEHGWIGMGLSALLGCATLAIDSFWILFVKAFIHKLDHKESKCKEPGVS